MPCLINKFVPEHCTFDVRGIIEVGFTPFTNKRILNRVGDKWTIDTTYPWVRFYFEQRTGFFQEEAKFSKNGYYYETNLNLKFSPLSYTNSEALKPLMDQLLMAYVVTAEGNTWLLGAETGLRADKYFSGPGSKTNGYNGYELNWIGTGLGQMLQLTSPPAVIGDRQVKHFTYHFRGGSLEESVVIADFNINNLNIYDTLNGGTIQNDLRFQYIEGVAGSDCLPPLGDTEDLTFDELKAIIYNRNQVFTVVIKLNSYNNVQQDAAILITYETNGIATNPQTFNYTFPANTPSLETLVGFNKNIDVLTFDFTKYNVGVRLNYTSNFTNFSTNTLALLNAAIDTAFTSNSGYYTLHIVSKNTTTTNITFTFNYV